METQHLIDLRKCPVCEFGVMTPDVIFFYACNCCAWAPFSIPKSTQHKDFQSDHIEQVRLRRDYLEKRYSLKIERAKERQQLNNLARKIAAQQEKIALVQVSNRTVEAELERIERENTKFEYSIEAKNFDFSIEHNKSSYAIVAENKRNYPHIEGHYDAKNGLVISYSQKPLESFVLALGFARKPIVRIEDAEIVYKVSLQPNDFQLFKPLNSWLTSPEVNIKLTGKWYVLLTPFKCKKEGRQAMFTRMLLDRINF